MSDPSDQGTPLTAPAPQPQSAQAGAPITLAAVAAQGHPSAAPTVDLKALVLLGLVLALIAWNAAVTREERTSLDLSERLYRQLSLQQCQTVTEQHLQLEKLKSELAAKTEEAAKLQSQNKATAQLLSQAERNNSDLRVEFKKKQDDLEKESAQFHKTSISYQRKMGDNQQTTFERWVATRGSLVNLEVQHERLIAAHNTLIGEYNTLRGSYALALGECTRLEGQYNRAVDQIQSLQGAYNTLDDKYRSLYSTAQRIASKCDDLVADNNQLRNNYNRLYNAYLQLGGR